jgi:hypothetical protein
MQIYPSPTIQYRIRGETMAANVRDIVLKTIGLICVTIAIGFIFSLLLELIVDIKDLHGKTGFLYEDGPPSFVLVPMLFTTLMLYVIPENANLPVRLIRSLMTTFTITYIVGVVGLIAKIESMDTGGVVAFCIFVGFFMMIGTILLEIAGWNKKRLSDHDPVPDRMGEEMRPARLAPTPFERKRAPPESSEEDDILEYEQELKLYHINLMKYRQQLENQERLLEEGRVLPQNREKMREQIREFKEQTERMEDEYGQRKKELESFRKERAKEARGRDRS